MPKTLKVISIVLFFISLFPLAFSQAQTTDSIRFVTYYPSPYGSYRELRTKRMAIGNTYIQYNDTCWPESFNSPCTNNQIYTDLNNNGWSPGEEDLVSLVVQGNVGIGTTGPTAPLHVHSSTSQGAIAISGVSDNGMTYSGIYFSDANLDMGINSWVISHIKDQSPLLLPDTFAFGRWFNHASTIPMVILPNGNVGIGTTNPGANRLKVVGGPIQATDGLIIETRTTNPAETDGRMWLCTDPDPYCDGV